MPWIIEDEEKPKEKSKKQEPEKYGNWIIEDDIETEKPKKEERVSNVSRDVVSEELRAHGYEPDFAEEVERAEGRGGAEVARGALSGATFGLSEHIPTLKPEKNAASFTGEVIGSVIPIAGLSNIFAKPLVTLASKSKVAKGALTSLAHLTGSGLTGAAYEGTKEAFAGHMPSTEDVLANGATWAALDGALQLAGLGGRFAKSLLSKAKSLKKPPMSVLNDTINELKSQGVNFSEPDRVNAAALSILEKPQAKATKELKLPDKKPLTKTESIARMELDNAISQGAKDLQGKKLTNKIEALSRDVVPLSEPYVPENLNAVEIAEETGNKALEERISGISQRATTERELGQNVQNDIKSRLQEAKDSYQPAYQLAEEAAQTIHHVPVNTASTATSILKSIDSLKTKPPGYARVISDLENVLTDAGFVIQRDANGAISEVISSTNPSLNKTMELGRRLNEIINFDTIEKTAQDRLKPVVRAVKQDVRNALRKNTEALEMFENAEREFAESAQKFGRDSIKAIRSSEATEKVANIIKSPTALADIKAVVSQQQFAQIERELLEKMKGMTEDKAKTLYRELRPSLSTDAQSVAEEILESKLPREAPSRAEKITKNIKDSIFNDLARSAETGERPSTVLNLWKTKRGQQIIKDSLKDNPNKSEILKYLQDQSFYDFASTFVDVSGKVDYKKFNKLLKDPTTIENIRMVGGEEAVAFFKNIENLSKRIDSNVALMEKIPTKEQDKVGKTLLRRAKERNQKLSPEHRVAIEALQESPKTAQKGTEILKGTKRANESAQKSTWQYKIDDYFKTLGVKPKLLFHLLGISHFGIGSVAATGSYELLMKLAKSPRAREAFKRAASSRTDPTAFFIALENLNQETE